MALGRKRSNFENIDQAFVPKNASEVLLKYRAIIIEKLVVNLQEIEKQKRSPSTGKLQQSINIEIRKNDNIILFELKMEDYWKFVDQGRKKGAKAPPQDAMLDFIKNHGIKPDITKGRNKKIKNTKNKRIRKAFKQVTLEQGRKQIAFLLARSIKRHGIKPTYFYSDVINEDLKDQLKKDITAALQKDIAVFFKEPD